MEGEGQRWKELALPINDRVRHRASVTAQDARLSELSPVPKGKPKPSQGLAGITAPRPVWGLVSLLPESHTMYGF